MKPTGYPDTCRMGGVKSVENALHHHRRLTFDVAHSGLFERRSLGQSWFVSAGDGNQSIGWVLRVKMKNALQPRASNQPYRRLMAISNVLLSEVLDYSLALLGVVLLSPILILLAIVVRLGSPGPIFYRRRVMGRGGTQFDAFKYRTMVVNGDEVLNAHPELKAQWLRDQKLKHDPRITRSGHWMRRLSLDELPQLFNVLRGQMSLVGPRMITPSELANYGDLADELLSVKPGITGLWQISGRSNLNRDDRVRLDMQYVRNRTLWMNCRLIVLTIPAALKGTGAY